MYPKLQRFLVLGIARSGFAVAQYLLKEGAKVYVYDDVDAGVVLQNKEALCASGAIEVKKDDLSTMQEMCDALVLSPGVAIDHPLAVSFRRRKKAVLGESEIAARSICAPFVAVTGTNGKTTTVSMIAEALQSAGHSAYACGNIGTPMISLIEVPHPYIAVTEISSFQLETLNSFRPHIAVVLNLSQDHLNRHYNMENYAFLKAKLLKNLTETEYAVLNYDDEVVRTFAEKTKANVLYFSLHEKTNGAYMQDGILYFMDEKILSANQMLIGGAHNIQNALATICVLKTLGLSAEEIKTALSNFHGVKHRLLTIGEVEGVVYVDDSKATNVDATIKAVRSMQKETVLLLGGKDKRQRYDGLFEAIKDSKVVHTVLYGENRFSLIADAQKTGWRNVTLCMGFAQAVFLAKLVAKEGQTVLLSPASASFDEFTDYEERGDRFAEMVEEFKAEVDKEEVRCQKTKCGSEQTAPDREDE